jgi:hypothetical protein
MRSKMLTLCDRRFLARHWQQGAAADYTYFLCFLFFYLITRLYVVLKKSSKNIWWLHKKVFGVVFFFLREGKTKASFRKSLKGPGREAHVRVRACSAKCCPYVAVVS